LENIAHKELGHSAKEVALLILWTIYPCRMHKAELEASVVRHDYSEKNAKLAVSRLVRYVDDDGKGNLRLRNSGVDKAEELISRASPPRRFSRRRLQGRLKGSHQELGF
jgi:hypothetical protein